MVDPFWIQSLFHSYVSYLSQNSIVSTKFQWTRWKTLATSPPEISAFSAKLVKDFTTTICWPIPKSTNRLVGSCWWLRATLFARFRTLFRERFRATSQKLRESQGDEQSCLIGLDFLRGWTIFLEHVNVSCWLWWF